jgi:hypothetical protein
LRGEERDRRCESRGRREGWRKRARGMPVHTGSAWKHLSQSQSTASWTRGRQEGRRGRPRESIDIYEGSSEEEQRGAWISAEEEQGGACGQRGSQPRSMHQHDYHTDSHSARRRVMGDERYLARAPATIFFGLPHAMRAPEVSTICYVPDWLCANCAVFAGRLGRSRRCRQPHTLLSPCELTSTPTARVPNYA